MVHEHNSELQLKGNSARRGKASWNKGLSKDTDDRLAQASKTLKENVLSGKTVFRKWNHSSETKMKMSEGKKKLYLSGWEPTCGRAKKYDYTSHVAGKIKVDGKWEIEAAMFLDSIGVVWKRNTRRFEYTNLAGKKSTYQPDFYVNDWDCFIEVKGYETDIDRCKWTQFPNKLEVWRKDKIDEIRKTRIMVLQQFAKL